MPALQVRDFPADLYEDLKKCAAREHRSMAQQTIKAVEEMLNRRKFSVFSSAKKKTFDVETDAERIRRIEKRKALFAEIEELSKKLPKDLPDAAEINRMGHYERDKRIMEPLGIEVSYDDYI
ncbi:argininosuccinate lyase [Adlercreutzia sp. ZJ304]|uniref:argininosuccinate lyase n=1 Tax=Adlercreutzia sp. ZJ304 TaxID=2709791 RepID=UPI0013EB4DF5|nr:argininosuccinate lyase [Adlercreutzia sp. ZJ304]